MYVAIVAACSEIVWGLHPKQYHNDDKHFHIFCEIVWGLHQMLIRVCSQIL